MPPNAGGKGPGALLHSCKPHSMFCPRLQREQGSSSDTGESEGLVHPHCLLPCKRRHIFGAGPTPYLIPLLFLLSPLYPKLDSFYRRFRATAAPSPLPPSPASTVSLFPFQPSFLKGLSTFVPVYTRCLLPHLQFPLQPTASRLALLQRRPLPGKGLSTASLDMLPAHRYTQKHTHIHNTHRTQTHTLTKTHINTS